MRTEGAKDKGKRRSNGRKQSLLDTGGIRLQGKGYSFTCNSCGHKKGGYSSSQEASNDYASHRVEKHYSQGESTV